MSTSSPVFFVITILLTDDISLDKAFGMSVVMISRYRFASIAPVIGASWLKVRLATSTFVMNSCWVLPYAQVLALIHPHLSFTKIACILSVSGILSTLMGQITTLLCICFVSSRAAFVPDLPNFLIPAFKLQVFLFQISYLLSYLLSNQHYQKNNFVIFIVMVFVCC